VRKRTLWFVGALVLIASLTVSCTASPDVSPPAVQTPSATLELPASSPRPTVSPSPPGEMIADQLVSNNIPVDGGSREFATGVTTVGDDGVPRSYLVAEGDGFAPVAERFGLTASYLVLINAVRRDNTMVLYVGDTLNMGARTITTIGDQNGVVYDHLDRMPQPHPAQEG
jgi:hypothetical protein